ncbi:MAG: penicillin-binding protein 1C [bacterium]|jgi:penicillin-binding protein 1C
MQKPVPEFLRQISRKILRHWRTGAGLCLLLIAAGIVILLLPMDTSRYLQMLPSEEIQDRDGRLLYPFLNEREEWCMVRPLVQISPYLIRATIAAEDQRFGKHPGVDPVAILRAVGQNLQRGRIFSGASTLAMQVVKMQSNRRPGFAGKIVQAIQAVRLYMRVSDEDILWAYLNKAPYGSNLTGCEAAARRYFGKSALELTLAEAALLAGLPRAPGLYMPLRHPQQALARRNHVLLRMWQEGMISEQEYQQASNEPLTARWHDFPRLAPHLAFQYREAAKQHKVLRLTLNAALQQRLEEQLKQYLRHDGGEISNAAALVIDVSSAEVLARAGSADFWNHQIDGQVDVCRAERSPGSALKPFTYALAMEQQKLYASEILLDEAWNRGLYNPENFDLSYQGLITAAQALKTSRNVPAVTVLERVGVRRIHTILRESGILTLRHPPEHYGLGLTLGNCEVRLEELAGAYTMLANLGEYRALRHLLHEPESRRKRVLEQDICIKMYEMLETSLPDELTRDNIHTVQTNTRVCMKTGTSQGYRDAWCFLYNQQYVVGVWLGNNDGRPAAGLTGAKAALPLASRIFRSLPTQAKPAFPATQNSLKKVTVCSMSGLPVSAWCRQTREEFFPKSQFLHRVCDMHHPDLRPEAPDNAVVERVPATAQGWDLANIRIPFIRKLQKVVSSSRDREFRILSPVHRSEFILTGEENGDRLQLKSSVQDSNPVHWYLNRQFLGTSHREAPLYLELKEGEQELTCMNAEGQTDTVKFTVLSPYAKPLVPDE